MSIFELAIPIVLRHEGGFVNDAADPGGATNFGVSLRWLVSQGLLDKLEHDEGDVTQDAVQAVKLMSQAEAEMFYKDYWWTPGGYEAILAQMVANKVFDTAVNMGTARAVNFAQKIVGITPPYTGHLGPKTLAGINAMPTPIFLASYQNAQAAFYRALVAANPARGKFLAGWLNRAYDRI